MTDLPTAAVRLHITVKPTVTVLPRCLQILSRRGFILTNLRTTPADSAGEVTMECTVEGPERWHDALVPLLERIIDVHTVTTETTAQQETSR